jgi:hypothetical protein
MKSCSTVQECIGTNSKWHFICAVFSTDVPHVSISPLDVNLDEVVNLTCSVIFGSPINDPSFVTPDQFPQLSMAFGQQDFNTQAPLNYIPGRPMTAPHRMSRVSELTSLV